MILTRRLIGLLAALSLASLAHAQEDPETKARLDALEQGFTSLASDVERIQFRDVIPELGESEHGLGPAASKVYEVGQGLSIGGYGEFLFQERRGNTDRFDTQRVVTYVGYRFDEHWLFNSELEFEHATTSESSGTTSSDGSVSAEFAYLDYLHSDDLAFRGGLLLIPMGFINEQHEPTTYLPANRPQTERRIIPSTWRENGLGVFGAKGSVDYKLYVVNGLNGEKFDSSGLRDGRQKGNRAAAEDIAVVGRADWMGRSDVSFGGSFYYGDSGQDAAGIPDLGTTILEVHGQWESGPWRARALYAMAEVDDAGEFNLATGENLAEELNGHYVELGYDLLAKLAPESGQSLTPFVRYENIDTQASLPSGFTADPSGEDDIVTFGVAWQPIDRIILKLDYEDFDEGNDQMNLLLGYVF